MIVPRFTLLVEDFVVLKCDVSSSNVARRMSCCLVVNSSQSVMQCDACIRKELHAECSAPAQVLEYSAPESVAYAVPTATATGCFGSFSVVPTVSTLTCGKVHRASTGSVCCSCACRGIHRACTSSVLGRASTGTGLLGASACSLCAHIATTTLSRLLLYLHLWCNTSRQHQ